MDFSLELGKEVLRQTPVALQAMLSDLFAVVGNTPDPARVDQSSGLIKCELGQIQHYSADTGKPQDNQHYLPHVTTRAGPAVATVLMQLTGQRQLKMETFAGKTASQVVGFDAGAQLYER